MREVTPTWDILHKFPSDYHWNEEAGHIWLKRLVDVYPHMIWINPTEEKYWQYSQSTQIIQEIIGEDRMFPMTLSGLEDAMKELAR